MGGGRETKTKVIACRRLIEARLFENIINRIQTISFVNWAITRVEGLITRAV